MTSSAEAGAFFKIFVFGLLFVCLSVLSFVSFFKKVFFFCGGLSSSFSSSSSSSLLLFFCFSSLLFFVAAIYSLCSLSQVEFWSPSVRFVSQKT